MCDETVILAVIYTSGLVVTIVTIAVLWAFVNHEADKLRFKNLEQSHERDREK